MLRVCLGRTLSFHAGYERGDLLSLRAFVLAKSSSVFLHLDFEEKVCVCACVGRTFDLHTGQ